MSELDGVTDVELLEETEVVLGEEVTPLDEVVVLVVVSVEVVVSVDVVVSVEIVVPPSVEEKGMLGKTISHDASNKVIKPMGINKCFFMGVSFKIFYHFKL
jgi:hypothetical protein